MIDIKKIHYSNNGREILSLDHLVLGDHPITGIIGPNGSGKTTFLKHLTGEIPTKETIYLNGKDISTYSPKEFAKMVAILTQFNDGVNPFLKVEELIQMGRYPHKGFFEPYDQKDEEIVEEIMERFDLKDFRHRFLHTLSGGELQRSMMAKVFATKPSVILMDEPTNHLDSKYKIECMEMLQSFSGPVIPPFMIYIYVPSFVTKYWY